MSWTGITGSSAFDVAACPARAVLPVCRLPEGEAASRGTELHIFAQKLTEDPANRDKWLAEVSEEYRHTAEALDLNEAQAGLYNIQCEVTFVLNVETQTCYRLGVGVDRKYEERARQCGNPLGKYEIPFTVDVLGVTKDGVPVELDYKSGRHIGDIQDHGQRRVCAAGLMFYYGVDTVLSRVAYIWDNGKVQPEGHEFSVFDAMETCEFLKKAIDEVEKVAKLFDEGGIPNVFPDREKQCKYCACFDACPYWTGLVKGALGKTIDTPVTDQEQAQLYDNLKDLEKAVSETLDRIKERIYKSALPLDDKYEFSAKDQAGRKSFDAGLARGLITTLLQQQGLDEVSIGKKLESLNRQGAPITVIRKRKR